MIDDMAALRVLAELGYVPVSLDADFVRRGIAEFQRFYGLKRSGQLDNNTRDALGKPRCRFPNKVLVLKTERLRERMRSVDGRVTALRIERWQGDVTSVEPKPWPKIEKKPFKLLYEFGCGAAGERQQAVLRAM